MLANIDAQRLHATVEALAAFGTRHTLSSTDDDARGIGAARRYLEATLRESANAAEGARLQVKLDPHRVEPDGRRIDRSVDVVNVVATLPGTMPEASARHYYVIGHYDSRASDVMQPDADAPGANDDASGVAVVLELARVMAEHEYDATLVFMATAAEEQGLLGADRHARAAREAGIDIRAVLSNDIVGDPTSPSGALHDREIRVFSEGLPVEADAAAIARLRALSVENDSGSRQLARYVATIAGWHELPVRPLLVFRPDRFLRGGDHTAFNRAGYPAVRLCEVEENYDRQHQDPRNEDGRRFGDVPENVDPTYLANVARLDAAALAHLANAPSSPPDARIITAELTNDTTIRWSPSPEPDVAGYEIVWRRTTSPVWEHVRDVGDTTEATLELSKDNWFFGVRAFDAHGYRSPVAFPGVAKE